MRFPLACRIYEPESWAFGGTDGMAIAHDVFCADSPAALAGTGTPGGRERAILLISAMTRAVGLDPFETGDVWARLAALRPPAGAPAPDRRAGAVAAMIDATALAEPWEAAVTAILRAYCQQQATPATPGEPGDAIAKTTELIGQGEPTTAAFRSRAGLAALDLAASQPEAGTAQLHDAIAKLAATDAYAARNALSHPMMRARMTCNQEQQLTSVVTAAGLGDDVDGAGQRGHLAAARPPRTARRRLARHGRPAAARAALEDDDPHPVGSRAPVHLAR